MSTPTPTGLPAVSTDVDPAAQQYPVYAPANPKPPMSGLAIAAFIVAFFAGLVAVVLGVFALRQIWVRGTRGVGLAWAGIIIGAVSGVLQSWLIMLFFRVAANSVV